MDEVSASNMAIGIGTKRFYGKPTSPNLWYYGGFVDYGWGGGTDDLGEYYETEYSFTYYFLMSYFGHRWRNSSNTFTEFGIMSGFTGTLSNEEIDENGRYENDPESYLIVMLEFSFGFER